MTKDEIAMEEIFLDPYVQGMAMWGQSSIMLIYYKYDVNWTLKIVSEVTETSFRFETHQGVVGLLHIAYIVDGYQVIHYNTQTFM